MAVLTSAKSVLPIPEPEFVSFELSYSTADLERSIFFGSESLPTAPQGKPEQLTILVVNGEMYALEGNSPTVGQPLTPESGIFGIIGSGPDD